MSRPTPFELVFAPLAAEHFEAIRTEAGSARPIDLPAFMKFPATQRLVADIEGEGVSAYLLALFAAYRFWDAGKPVRTVGRKGLEALIASPPAGAPAAPPRAAYLQFPERWFWTRIDEIAPHEPLDGIFVVGENAGRETSVVAILGLRPDRDGFSQVAATVTPGEYAAAAGLARQPPFQSTIVGGEKAGVRSIASTAELLLVTQLALLDTSR